MEKITQPNPEKDAIVARVLIHTNNFKLLKAQKALLVNMQSKKSTTEAEWNAIEGIVNMIDAIQDIACDHYNFDPNEVFNFTNEVDTTVKMSLAECRKVVMSEDDGDEYFNWK